MPRPRDEIISELTVKASDNSHVERALQPIAKICSTLEKTMQSKPPNESPAQVTPKSCKIHFGTETIVCQHGDNLRKVLLQQGLPLYNGIAKTIHCRGLGTCGTCAIEIEGHVSETTAVERWRLKFPPHSPPSPLRLACQCKVLGDLNLTKHDGMWGSRLKDQSTNGSKPRWKSSVFVVSPKARACNRGN